MNDVFKLTERFQEFGEILNVFARYNNNPRSTIITFSKVEEADAALKRWKSPMKIQYIRIDVAISYCWPFFFVSFTKT